MNMAQNQQPQNGPLKFPPQQLQHQINMREQPQQQFQNTHSSPADMFSSPAISNETIRRPSPHPGNPQQLPAVQPSQPPQLGSNGVRVQLTPQEMGQRIIMLRSQMSSQEQMIKQLQLQHPNVRGTPQEAQLLARVKEMTIEYNKRKEYIQRFAPGWEAFRCVPLQPVSIIFYSFLFVKETNNNRQMLIPVVVLVNRLGSLITHNRPNLLIPRITLLHVLKWVARCKTSNSLALHSNKPKPKLTTL